MLDRGFAKVVSFTLVLMVLSLAGLLFVQVVLRNGFDSGIFGAEVISRHMVLWIALLGGMLGTRMRSHIAIDLVTRSLPRRARNILRVFLDAVSCAVTYYLATASYNFVMGERLFETMLFADIPVWWIQLIIPFGFGMISLEYAIGVMLDLRRLSKYGEEHTTGQWRKYIST